MYHLRMDNEPASGRITIVPIKNISHFKQYILVYLTAYPTINPNKRRSISPSPRQFNNLSIIQQSIHLPILPSSLFVIYSSTYLPTYLPSIYLQIHLTVYSFVSLLLLCFYPSLLFHLFVSLFAPTSAFSFLSFFAASFVCFFFQDS
jgi:hypothetical protein